MFKDIRFWLIIILFVAIGLGVHFYIQAENLQNQLTIQTATYTQNNAALEDSLHKFADSIQTMAVKIANLNSDTTKLHKENRILATKYRLFVDSIRVSDTAIVVFEEDSLGKYVKASFEGKKSIATYRGYTKTYLTPLSTTPVYQLDIDFDVIQARSEFLRNDSSGLFYIRTTSLTEGVKLIGYTTLDSVAFPYLYGMKRDPLVINGGRFFVGGTVNREMVTLGIGIKPSDWLFFINYKVFEKLTINNQAWYDQIQLGAYYTLF